jgi:hypothetical protein
MAFVVNAPVYDAVADDGIFVNWHRLMNDVSKLSELVGCFIGLRI